jgi:cyclohexyl-isocyanide hydratase
MKIGFLLFENVTQLDFTAPFEVFARMPNSEILLISKGIYPVKSDKGLSVIPTHTFVNCPQLDLICVPGGGGISGVIEDEEALNFLKNQAHKAQYITSVCTGALVLAVAGLLDGFKATTHWLSIDLLKKFETVEVIEARVVKDRNRFTGGGVTAGIDFALTIAAEIYGENIAKEIQLMIEYNPQPPFNVGSPKLVDAEILEKVISSRKGIQTERLKQIEGIISVYNQSKYFKV